MKYPLLIISRMETDTKAQIAALTFYPSDSACIKPRPYENLVASYVQRFDPGIELAEVVSDKGRHRLKLLLRAPACTDEERRTMGTMFYGLLFGHSPGGDEHKKGAADALYYTICDLCQADASSEEAWAGACRAAIASIQRLASQYFV